MAKNKHRAQKNEIESYTFDVENWEANYYLLSHGEYVENPTLTLLGKIIQPTLKSATNAKLDLIGTTKPDDYCEKQGEENQLQNVGSLVLNTADKTLQLICSLPFHSLAYLTVAVAAGKIKHVSALGTNAYSGPSRHLIPIHSAT